MWRHVKDGVAAGYKEPGSLMTMELPDQPSGAPTSRLYLEREIVFHLFKPLFFIFVVIGIWTVIGIYILTNTRTLIVF